MLTETQVRLVADACLRAWNSPNLEAIMSHHTEIVLTSPVPARLLDDGSGTVRENWCCATISNEDSWRTRTSGLSFWN
jgi:hypothetical protein